MKFTDSIELSKHLSSTIDEGDGKHQFLLDAATIRFKPEENYPLTSVEEAISELKAQPVYIYKGSVNYDALPTTGVKTGWVYNITSDSSDKTYLTGDNVAAVVSEDGTLTWDKLAATTKIEYPVISVNGNTGAVVIPDIEGIKFNGVDATVSNKIASITYNPWNFTGDEYSNGLITSYHGYNSDGGNYAHFLELTLNDNGGYKAQIEFNITSISATTAYRGSYFFDSNSPLSFKEANVLFGCSYFVSGNTSRVKPEDVFYTWETSGKSVKLTFWKHFNTDDDYQMFTVNTNLLYKGTNTVKVFSRSWSNPNTAAATSSLFGQEWITSVASGPSVAEVTPTHHLPEVYPIFDVVDSNNKSLVTNGVAKIPEAEAGVTYKSGSNINIGTDNSINFKLNAGYNIRFNAANKIDFVPEKISVICGTDTASLDHENLKLTPNSSTPQLFRLVINDTTEWIDNILPPGTVVRIYDKQYNSIWFQRQEFFESGIYYYREIYMDRDRSDWVGSTTYWNRAFLIPISSLSNDNLTKVKNIFK